jgi:hypothetical protein
MSAKNRLPRCYSFWDVLKKSWCQTHTHTRCHDIRSEWRMT